MEMVLVSKWVDTQNFTFTDRINTGYHNYELQPSTHFPTNTMEITEISEYCRKNGIKPQTTMLTAIVASTQPSRQMAVSERPSPQLEREQNLLAEIADITDSETANKAKDLLHSEKHTYTFAAYLYWLTELSLLLGRSVPKDKALKVICTCVDYLRSAGLAYRQLAKDGII